MYSPGAESLPFEQIESAPTVRAGLELHQTARHTNSGRFAHSALRIDPDHCGARARVRIRTPEHWNRKPTRADRSSGPIARQSRGRSRLKSRNILYENIRIYHTSNKQKYPKPREVRWSSSITSTCASQLTAFIERITWIEDRPLNGASGAHRENEQSP